MLSPLANTIKGRATVADRIEQYGADARSRLRPRFQAASVDYPPWAVFLVGLKEEELLEVWGKNAPDDGFSLISKHPILGTSGDLGPKLQEGDMQIPEGVYRVESLNPNSRFHLSLRLNYPNPFDLVHAKEEGREYPGSDIMIHGSASSIGCLAMGNQVAEELFVLASDTGLKNIEVILAPVDLRIREIPLTGRDLPEWADELYASIRTELQRMTPER